MIQTFEEWLEELTNSIEHKYNNNVVFAQLSNTFTISLPYNEHISFDIEEIRYIYYYSISEPYRMQSGYDDMCRVIEERWMSILKR